MIITAILPLVYNINSVTTTTLYEVINGQQKFLKCYSNLPMQEKQNILFLINYRTSNILSLIKYRTLNILSLIHYRTSNILSLINYRTSNILSLINYRTFSPIFYHLCQIKSDNHPNKNVTNCHNGKLKW